MNSVRGRLGEARLSVNQTVELDELEVLFEIGWTWGIASDAPEVALQTYGDYIGAQPAGLAESSPALYFTTQVTEAIGYLFAERTMTLGVLNEEQERLASALRLRRDLTQKYWSRLARFGESWPVENIPWRTVDGKKSNYFSLLVCALVIQEFQQRNVDEHDLRRIEALMSELARRARILHRPLRGDPGTIYVLDELIFMEATFPVHTRFGWLADEFAPVLLKCAAQLAALTSDPFMREELLDLATTVWYHLQPRLNDTERSLTKWRSSGQMFSSLQPTDGAVSWPLTAQIVDALVTAGTPPTW